MSDHITMCPYCKQLFDVEVGDKFKSGEIKKKWGRNEKKIKETPKSS